MYCWCWSAVQIHANHDCRTCRLFFCCLTLHISRFRQSEIVVMAFFSSSIYYFCITQEVRQLNKQFLVLSPPSLCLSLFAVRVCVLCECQRGRKVAHILSVFWSLFSQKYPHESECWWSLGGIRGCIFNSLLTSSPIPSSHSPEFTLLNTGS